MEGAQALKRSREQMLAAAACEIVQHGYAASSLSSIASHLGLTKGALVRQFPTKEDLAWGIIATLRDAIGQDRAQSLALHPRSGVRALLRFLLVIGERTAMDPRFGAAVVLFFDRSSPGFKNADLFSDWKGSLESFLKVAQREGEIYPTEDLQELAEYIFVTNLGEAVFVARAWAPFQSGRKLRFTGRALRGAGVQHIDELIDEILRSKTDWTLHQRPGCAGISCPRTVPSNTEESGG